MSERETHPVHAARLARMCKGPALSYLELETLIIDAESALKILAFVFDRTVRENAKVDDTTEFKKMNIVLDESDFSVLTEVEYIASDRMQKLVDAFDRAHRIDDTRKPLPIEEQVP